MKRLLLLAAVGVALVWGAASAYRFREVWTWRWQRWRHPPERNTAAGPMGAEILSRRQEEWARRVARDYARIRSELDEAKRRGLSTADLEPKLAHALDVARQGRYQDALMLLNLVEVRIPRAPEKIIPTGEARRPAPAKKIRGVPVR